MSLNFMGAEGFLVVFCTASGQEEARRLAGLIVDRELAACVTLIPGVESHYVWEGKREVSSEWLLLIKTTRARYGELESALRATHSYACPEILGVEVAEGSEAYLRWVRGMAGG